MKCIVGNKSFEQRLNFVMMFSVTQSWSRAVVSFVTVSEAKAGEDLYGVKKSKICGSVVAVVGRVLAFAPKWLDLFVFNLMASEKLRRRRSVCLSFNLSIWD